MSQIFLKILQIHCWAKATKTILNEYDLIACSLELHNNNNTFCDAIKSHNQNRKTTIAFIIILMKIAIN